MINLLKSRLFFGIAFVGGLYLFQPGNMLVAGLLCGAVTYMVNWLIYRGTPTFKAALIAFVISGTCFVASLAFTSSILRDAFQLFWAAWVVIAFAETTHSLFIASRASAT